MLSILRNLISSMREFLNSLKVICEEKAAHRPHKDRAFTRKSTARIVRNGVGQR
jgi:hypothetical protein